MEKEIWEEINGYNGLYMVSNIGRIRRMEHYRRNRHGIYKFKGGIKKLCISNCGYYVVSLKGKLKLVHRLKAIAFIPNPNNLPCINHRDGNKLNNLKHSDGDDNLEWCTYAHNNQHAYDMGLKTGYWKNKRGSLHSSSKPLICYDISMNELDRYGSAGEASEKTGFNQPQISKACRSDTKYKGYYWSYINTL